MMATQNSDSVHKWFNTVLLGVVLTLLGVIYSKIDTTLDKAVEKGNNNELRIVKIEAKLGMCNSHVPPATYLTPILSAILPEPIRVKSE